MTGIIWLHWFRRAYSVQPKPEGEEEEEFPGETVVEVIIVEFASEIEEEEEEDSPSGEFRQQRRAFSSRSVDHSLQTVAVQVVTSRRGRWLPRSRSRTLRLLLLLLLEFPLLEMDSVEEVTLDLAELPSTFAVVFV